MAANIAARQMLMRMKLTQECAEEILAVDGQGQDSIEDFARLGEKDVSAMFKSLTRPGGVNAGGQPNRGFKVSAAAQGNVTNMCYYLRHMTIRVNRPTTSYPQVTLLSVFRMKSQFQLEEAHKDPTTHPVADFKDLPKTKETIEEHLRAFRGVEKSSLGYVTRDDLFPPATAIDPEWGELGSRYDNIDDELIARMRIIDLDVPNVAVTMDHYEENGPFADCFVKDRSRVWDILVAIFSATEAWTVIKTFKSKRNGRAAWLALWSFYLGPNNLDHMASEAEKSLTTTHYNGESRNFTFDKFAMHMLKQHNIIEGLKTHGLVTDMTERRKVFILLEAIKTTKLDAVKTRIMSDDSLRTDYDKCITLFKDFVRRNHVEVSVATVATVAGTPGFKAEDDRYVPPAEWVTLTEEQKTAVRAARAARQKKNGEGGKPKPKGKGSGAKVAKVRAKAQKKMIKRYVKSLLSKPREDASDEDDEGEIPMKDSAVHQIRQKSPKSKGK